MARRRHPKKAVEAVVQYAESLGWRVRLGSGHVWAQLLCPAADRSGCIVRVFSTPENAENHAMIVKRKIDSCPHRSDG